MQRNNYSDERLSFLRPNAESTLNGTFQWGRKDNSTISKSQKTVKSPQRNLTKIDARTYTDVQSRGLASRIVKYHENGTRFNRSISMTNLCSKNSPLSVKKLEPKPQLRYDKAIKHNVSMTHIAPPDKSLFYGNTLSGLLRSASVISLHQKDDNLSSENRPIMHPPGTEKELQPTRSVLEVLKEISRKRINNEVSSDNEDVSADNSKKYCNRLIVENPHYNGTGSDYRLQQIQIQTTPQLTTACKRQRESAVDGYIPSACYGNAYQMKQQNDLPPASPEQQSKRRHHCNYNNDITSSLSSSAKTSNSTSSSKRKLYEADNSGYRRQEKLLRYQTDIHLPELSKAALSYGNATPITPLPNTPQTGIKDMPELAAAQKYASAPMPITNTTITDTTTTTQQAIKTPTKPKLTLFNKNYEPANKATLSAKSDDNENGNADNAYADINFVKPKKAAANSIGGSSVSNLVMQRTRKSKLALMLSGLRGELYLGDEEEEQRLKGANTNEQAKQKVTLQQPQQQESPAIDKPDASIKIAPNVSLAVSAPTSVAASVAVASITPQTTKITSPLTGIKLTPMSSTTTATTTPTKPPAPTTTPAAPAFSFGHLAPKTSTTATPSAKPSFSFGAPNTTTPDTAASTVKPSSNLSFSVPATSTVTTTAPLLQFAPTPATTTSSAPFSAAGTFNFNQSPATQTATLVTASTTPTTGGFNFGNKTAASSTQTTVSSSSKVTPAFSFGGGNNNASSNLSTQAATTTPGGFNFGASTTNTSATFGSLTATSTKTDDKLTAEATPTNAATVTANPTAFNFTSKQPSGGFAFGTNTNSSNIKSTNEPPKMFNFASPTTTTKTNTTNSGGAFAFGSNDKPTATVASASSTSFGVGGGLGNQAAAAPPKFGAEVTKAGSSTNSFVFGTKTATPPMFGGISVPQNQENKNATTNSFLFGGNNNSNNNAASEQPNKSLFGVNATNNNAGNLFGGVTTTTATNTASPNAFAFSNAASSAPAAPQADKPFSFGTNAATNNNAAVKSANIFGSTSNQQSNQSFNFGNQQQAGATNEANKVTTTTNMANSFNFSNVNQSSNAFSFGGAGGNGAVSSSAPGVQHNQKSGAGGFNFGNQPSSNSAPNSGLFNFGSTGQNTPANNSNNKAATTSNLGGFGNTSSNSGGFVFGSNSKAPAPSFGGSTTSANNNGSGFAFGATPAAHQTNINSASAGNLFANANSAPQRAVPTNLFGGAIPAAPATNTSATPANIFGSNTNSTPVFGATSAPAPQTSNNVFAVPQSAGSERLIRRATRRLSKQ